MYLEDWLPTDIDLIPIQCIPALPTLAGPMGNDGTTVLRRRHPVPQKRFTDIYCCYARDLMKNEYLV